MESNSSLSLRSCSVEKAVRGRLSSCAALELSRFFPLRDLGPEVNYTRNSFKKDIRRSDRSNVRIFKEIEKKKMGMSQK